MDSPWSQDSLLEVPLNVLDSGPSLSSATVGAVGAGVAEAALKDSQEVSDSGQQQPSDHKSELNADILQVFGNRRKEIVNKGLPAEERKTLLTKYSPPINCTFIDPPRVNLEVKAAVDSIISKRDDR
ncbi:hypothetical protein KPH14_010924, partial [Odynerus spinipes]